MTGPGFIRRRLTAPGPAGHGENRHDLEEGEEAGKPVPDEELRKLLAQWGAAQKTLKTIHVKFKQSKDTALLPEPELSEGTICIEKPDGYRQEVFERNEKGELDKVGVIILKPPYVWVYMPRSKSAEQVDLTKLRGAGKESPLKALGDIISFDEERIR
ncbi:MAG: outer membrane lipoprotein carrier protein LolA, partial [Planctomycetota bacterium]